MKIVHICMAQYSDGWTYQENLLAKYHKNLGNDVTLITSMYCYSEGRLVEDTKTEFIDCNGVKVKRLQKLNDGLMKKVPTYQGFYEALEEEKPDVIFSHGCQYKDVVYVVKYLKNYPDVKLYVDNHADFTNSAKSFFSKNVLHKIIWKHYSKLLVPYAKKFYGVLPARVDFLTDVYGIPKEKCQLLVMGADDEQVIRAEQELDKIDLRGKYKIDKSDFLIVTGGKIDKAKLQIEFLMKSVKSIENKKVKLLVFGSIDEEIKDRILSLVDGDKVIYAGWVTPEQSYDYFAIADLVVFPGRHSVFWEQAAGQGKPLMVKDWPGTHHVDVGGNACFIAQDNEDVIKNDIENIINNDDKYKKMLEVAKNDATKEFSYKEIAKRSIEI